MYKNKYNLRISNSVLIAIIGALITIFVSIIISYSSLPSWSIYIALASEIIMLVVLLWISPLPTIINNMMKKRRHDKLAMNYFHDFKKKNFTNQFERILSDDRSYTFHNVIKKIKSSQQEFKTMSDPQVELIKARYFFWLNCLYYFNGKINPKILTFLLEEFRSLIIAYHRICIEKPLQEISDIKNINGINPTKDFEKEWKKGVQCYNNFKYSYNTLLEEIHKEFEEIRPGIPSAEEL